MQTVQQLLKSKSNALVTTITSDSSVLDALRVMSKGSFAALPVLEGERLVGVFSERDYARKIVLAGKTSAATLVREVMTPNPVFVAATHTIEQCMELMIDRGFRHLPVLSEDQKVIGMISMKDAVHAVISEKEALLDTVVTVGAQSHEDRENVFQRIAAALKAELVPLQASIERVIAARAHGSPAADSAPEATAEALRLLSRMASLVSSMTELNEFKRTLKSAKVLVATQDPAEELVIKMALGGTGVQLDTASSVEAGLQKLEESPYDIVCVNSALIEVGTEAKRRNAGVKAVFMTSESAETYIEQLRKHSFLTNVVSQSETDRAFTTRSVLSTVGKIVNSDYFGMEKYLNWGADIREFNIDGSRGRAELIAGMQTFLRDLGIRRVLVDRCANVAEELLMNAIYDAPTDRATGKQLYNHLPRSGDVDLQPSERAIFRYGCDGTFFGISVRDPFGSVDRETILDYLASCFAGQESPLHVDKGGGGHGLFIVFRSASLTVFNVQKGRATEVIALFDLDTKSNPGAIKKTAFHYFDV